MRTCLKVEITILLVARKHTLKSYGGVVVMEKVPVQVGGYNYVINTWTIIIVSW